MERHTVAIENEIRVRNTRFLTDSFLKGSPIAVFPKCGLQSRLGGNSASDVPLGYKKIAPPRLKSAKLRKLRVAGYDTTTAMAIYTFP